MLRKEIRLRVNGIEYESVVEPRTLLVHYIRDELGLTGTHIGCVEGKCGACTVLLNGRSIKSCLTFAVEANGAEVTTIEGLSSGQTLHPLQEAFCKEYGLQCGFCTPGMIMAAYELLAVNPKPTDAEIRRGLAGNLCRCTGYQTIVSAVKAAAEKIGAARG